MLSAKDPKRERSPTLAPSRIAATGKRRPSVAVSKTDAVHPNDAKPSENAAPHRSSISYRKPSSRLNLGALVMLKGRISNFQQQMYRRRGHQMQTRVENTYRTEPKPQETFKPHEAQRYVDNSLKFFLDGLQYNRKACGRLVKAISDDIRRKVKDNLQLKRYKLVCHVIVSENIGQSLQASSRTVWNDQLDNFVSSQYSTPYLVGTATLYALYYE